MWGHTQRTKSAQERHPLTGDEQAIGAGPLFMIVLMTLFNCFSHGTQDLYPLFLQVEKGFGTDLTGKLATIGPHRRDLRRPVLRRAVRAHRAQARDHHRGAAVAADPEALGVQQRAADARPGRVLAAGDGAGCLGRGAGASRTNCRRMRCARRCPALPIRSAISSRPACRGCPTTLAEANHKQYGLTMAVFIAGVAVMLAIVTALGPGSKGANGSARRLHRARIDSIKCAFARSRSRRIVAGVLPAFPALYANVFLFGICDGEAHASDNGGRYRAGM